MNGTAVTGPVSRPTPIPAQSGLVDATRAIFSAEAMARRWGPGYRHRPGQDAMAELVASTLTDGGVLAVQAGTGVGKTLAYLVPLLLSGRRAVLSTATQALQDQLHSRDIPAVTQALGMPVRVALLKGRSAYVCLHRLRTQVDAPGRERDPADSVLLGQLLRWAEASPRGDLSEWPALDARVDLRPLVTSTRDNCLGSTCPQHDRCAVYRARREALEADWVVVNHHVFMADLDVRESGVAALLPHAQALVFDEAHQFNDTAIGFLGRRLGSGVWGELSRDLLSVTRAHASGLRPWSSWALDLERCSRDLGALAGSTSASDTRIPWEGGAPAGIDAAAWACACLELDRVLGQLHEGLQACAEAAPDLARLAVRTAALRVDWRMMVGQPAPAGEVRWLSRHAARRWEVHQTPADCSGFIPGIMASRPGVAWVFTSATLGHDEALTGFTRHLGLSDLQRPADLPVQTARVPSPFDHLQQAALFVPSDWPEPADPDHLLQLAERVHEWATRLGGRTLVLTTTRRAARRMADRLRDRSAASMTDRLQIIAPDAGGRRDALERFRRSGGQSMVLVASGAFWDGVDLPGDALQLVVIDKLPFPPPDDPLIRARVQKAAEQGVDGFHAVHLSEAALALAQGVGRLIRTETDRGLVVVADNRLIRRSYGPAILQALPPMRWLSTEEEVQQTLDGLAALSRVPVTRSSTTGFPGF